MRVHVRVCVCARACARDWGFGWFWGFVRAHLQQRLGRCRVFRCCGELVERGRWVETSPRYWARVAPKSGTIRRAIRVALHLRSRWRTPSQPHHRGCNFAAATSRLLQSVSALAPTMALARWPMAFADGAFEFEFAACRARACVRARVCVSRRSARSARSVTRTHPRAHKRARAHVQLVERDDPQSHTGAGLARAAFAAPGTPRKPHHRGCSFAAAMSRLLQSISALAPTMPLARCRASADDGAGAMADGICRWRV